MGPTWVLSAPDGPHVGPMNLANRAVLVNRWICHRDICSLPVGMLWCICHHMSGNSSLLAMVQYMLILFTHCGLVTPYGDLDLASWGEQAITWTDVDLSSSEGNFIGNCSRYLSLIYVLEILNLKLLPHLAGGIQSRSYDQYVCTQLNHVRLSWTQAHCDCVMKWSVSSKKHTKNTFFSLI